MEDQFDAGLFVCTDYEVEKYQYKDIKQNCYCLKSSSTDYDLTGQIIWRAATQLAEYIIDNREKFQDKLVLELGAGAGISGLVCAQFSKKVYITDGNEIVTDLMKMNLEFSEKKNVEAEFYLWGKEGDKKFLSTKPNLKIDTIIGADILYWPEGIAPLSETLQTYFEINPKLEVYIASRIRSLWVERQFETELCKRSMKRTKLFEEGENKFFVVTQISPEEQQEKFKEIEKWEQESNQRSQESQQKYNETKKQQINK